jgi:GTPase
MSARNRAILIAIGRNLTSEIIEEHLDELAFLAETAGLESADRLVQYLATPDSKTYLGKGKLAALKSEVFSKRIDYLIFDDDLSPSQMRNLERELNPIDREERVRIYDRSLLILDIFLRRAQTAQATTQVELARNQYLLPRLTRLWTHLERQRGGTGTRGGAGEKEIETDRRNIRHQIAVLKEKLEKIEKQRKTQRKSRSNIVRAALVGYTNVGKSTLMNLLSGSDVHAEDKLFATVDSTVRKVVLGNIPFLLSDTVGFIRKLPHHLIESFKSTLDEVREADLLLHVVDAAHPFHDNQIEVVTKTLQEIGAGNIPTILVMNKTDLLNGKETADFEAMNGYYRQHGYEQIVFVSASTGQNIDALKQLVYEGVKKKHLTIYPNYLRNGYEYPTVVTDNAVES